MVNYFDHYIGLYRGSCDQQTLVRETSIWLVNIYGPN